MKERERDKIDHYIKGVADENEKAWVESLFLNGENNLYLKQALEKDWDNMNSTNCPSDVNMEKRLDHIHHLIRKNEDLKRRTLIYKFARVYVRAASIILLPILIAGGVAYNYFENKGKAEVERQVIYTIYAPLGARVSFILPDSTTGMLNSGSKLSYTLPFNNNRKVNLEGEGWFEVISDKNHPFEINACNSKVKVFGTSFNINAYPEEDYVEVVLKRGKVEFCDSIDNEKVMMLPSERLVFQNGSIRKSVIDPGKYNAWTEGKLIFRGDPMAEVARRIERWYNVKVVLSDKELERYSFRATFEDDKLESVLQVLSMTSPISYHITSRKLMQDGTWEKEIITISLKNV